jgi:hypothetical protein
MRRLSADLQLRRDDPRGHPPGPLGEREDPVAIVHRENVKLP